LQCALWHHVVETTHWYSLFFYSIPTEYIKRLYCKICVASTAVVVFGGKLLSLMVSVST